jgi:hypothetical protein
MHPVRGHGRNSMIRFSETVLEADGGHLRLADAWGRVLLDLRASEVEEAIRRGDLNPQRLHFSMFEYYRIRSEASSLEFEEEPEFEDQGLDETPEITVDLESETAGESESVGEMVNRYLDSIDVRHLDEEAA